MVLKEAWCTAVEGVAESDPAQVTTARRVPALAVSLSRLGSGQNSKFASNVSLTSLIVLKARIMSCCAVLCLCSVVFNCNPRDCSPPGSSVHGDSPGRNAGVGCWALQGICNAGIEPRSPALQVDSLPSEPPGKPRLAHLCLLNLLFLRRKGIRGLEMRGVIVGNGVGSGREDFMSFYVWYFEVFPSWDL